MGAVNLIPGDSDNGGGGDSGVGKRGSQRGCEEVRVGVLSEHSRAG